MLAEPFMKCLALGPRRLQKVLSEAEGPRAPSGRARTGPRPWSALGGGRSEPSLSPKGLRQSHAPQFKPPDGGTPLPLQAD